VFRELNRILKPGVRLLIFGFLMYRTIHGVIQRNIELWTGCPPAICCREIWPRSFPKLSSRTLKSFGGATPSRMLPCGPPSTTPGHLESAALRENRCLLGNGWSAHGPSKVPGKLAADLVDLGSDH